MLQTYAKANRKELSQIITIYQAILEFTFEELWMNIIIKHAKADADQMLDDINAKLIDVCDEYLKENNIGLDKYQLSMIVMDLYTKTITQLPQPFYVQARESKNLLKEYVKANKEYMEKCKKVKRENKELQEEADKLEKRNRELVANNNKTLEKSNNIPTISNGENKEIPKKNSVQSKKQYNHNTNDLATEFTF